MRAILTVNSPLRSMKPRVPSSGSTRNQRSPRSGTRPAQASSSATTGQVRIGAAEVIEDDGLGGAVGLGDGRAVRLPFGRAARAVDALDLVARDARGGDQRIEQGVTAAARRARRGDRP
jgi:hypothetical protein